MSFLDYDKLKGKKITSYFFSPDEIILNFNDYRSYLEITCRAECCNNVYFLKDNFKEKFKDIKNQEIKDIKFSTNEYEYKSIHYINFISNRSLLLTLINECNDFPYSYYTNVKLIETDINIKNITIRLHNAVDNGDIETVKSLIKYLHNVNIKDKNKENILYKSYKNKNIELFKYLIEVNRIDIDINNRIHYGETLLHYICKNNDKEYLKVLIDFNIGVNFNFKNYKGYTPLHFACMNNSLECLSMILDNYSLDLNCYNKYKRIKITSPLFLAFQNGHYDCVKLLITKGLKNGLNLYYKNYGKNGLNLYYKNYGNNQSFLHYICSSEYNDLELLKILIKILPINRYDSYFNTPLHYCVQYNKIEYFKIIMEKFTDNNDINKINQPKWLVDKTGGNTVLHLACTKKDSEFFDILIINKNIDLFKKNYSGKTPLHIACEYGNFYITKKLVNIYYENFLNGKFSNLNEQDFYGKTAFYYSCYNRHEDCIKFLIINREYIGLNVNIKDKNGKTAFYYSCYNRHEDCIKFLIINREYIGLNVNIKDKNGLTALDVLYTRNSLDLLTDECFNFSKKKILKSLFLIIRYGDLEVLKYLIKLHNIQKNDIFYESSLIYEHIEYLKEDTIKEDTIKEENLVYILEFFKIEKN